MNYVEDSTTAADWHEFIQSESTTQYIDRLMQSDAYSPYQPQNLWEATGEWSDSFCRRIAAYMREKNDSAVGRALRLQAETYWRHQAEIQARSDLCQKRDDALADPYLTTAIKRQA